MMFLRPIFDALLIQVDSLLINYVQMSDSWLLLKGLYNGYKPIFAICHGPSNVLI